MDDDDNSKSRRYHPILVTMYMWYIWSITRFKVFTAIILQQFGTWAPLWVISIMVGYHNMDKKREDDVTLKIEHIEFIVNNKLHRYYYDITVRSLWYFYFVGDCYNEYIKYARGLLPYDLSEHRFDSPKNEIEIKYTGYVDDEFRMFVLALGQNDKYSMKIDQQPAKTRSVTFNTINFGDIYD